MTKRCSANRSCATCEYWGGMRAVDLNPRWVKLETSSAKGVCQNPSEGWRGRERSNAATCRDYVTWRYMS